ncbi:FDF domain-containing protein [Chytridium lagenaria]|nr:FDF domain-containing protein [Chytridium lagenaria]
MSKLSLSQPAADDTQTSDGVNKVPSVQESKDNSEAAINGGRSNSNFNRGYQNYNNSGNQNFNNGHMRYPDQSGFNQRGRGTGNYRGGGGGNYRGRGHPGSNHGGNRGPRTRIPDSDYDFELANAKFNKEENKVEMKPSKTEDAGEAEPGEVADAEPTSPSTFYDKTSSFFDNISCEARDKAEGERRRVRQNEERRLNMETFGQVSIDGYRGGYRRGNYRGGRGGQRGGNRGYNNVRNGPPSNQ